MADTKSKSFIPMVDLRTQYHALKDDIDTALANVLEETAFIFGPNVHALEEELTKYLNIKHAISCASGTDALHLALRALEIKPGDEVIVPSFTFAASAEAVRYIDATPVFIDIDPETFNLNPDLVESKITDRTRAIIVVHLFGLPVNLESIAPLTKHKNISIVEDCAQSFGATIQDKQTGTLGDIACFSFFPSKNLGAYGDGGLICTDNDDLAERAKLLRNHGSPQRYRHDIIGYNSRLDEIQAAILRVKLKHIDEFNQSRRDIADLYTQGLSATGIKTPHQNNYSRHVFHQYTVLHENRDKIRQTLDDNNIASAIYYPTGLHQQAAFVDFTTTASLPVTERVSTHCLSLPMFPELSIAQVERVIDTVVSAIE